MMRAAIRAAVAVTRLLLVILLAVATPDVDSGSDIDIDAEVEVLHVHPATSPHQLKSTLFVKPRVGKVWARSCPHGRKLQKLCEKSCKSKSNPKCNYWAKKLMKCCAKSKSSKICDCEEDNGRPPPIPPNHVRNVFEATPETVKGWIEACDGITPLPDLNKGIERMRLKKNRKRFRHRTGTTYTFQRRLRENGIWSAWRNYSVVEDNLSGLYCWPHWEREVCCDHSQCFLWTIEEMFSVISVGIGYLPVETIETSFLNFTICDVKYSRKNFPRHIKFSADTDTCLPWEIEIRRVG